jgi:glycerate kinase
MRVLIAPDSFKGSLGAGAAAAALARGWLSARPGDQVTRLPLADGGEGTLEVLAAAVPGARWHRARVTGPAGGPVTARWLELPAGPPGPAGRGDGTRTAVVELARASGLPLLARPDPMGAQTTGLGELLGRALDAGAARILVGLGGSAATDGGTGALAALGARFLGAAGQRLPPGGGALAGLARADLSGLRPPPRGGVTCLTDVTAPLLGPRGAAAVYGPQKGAGPAQVARLEAGLARLAGILGGDPAAPGAGAAGGTGYGLATAWGAALAPGAAELSRLAGLDRALAEADLVITGEGRYDPTSLTGKTCGTVLEAAAAAGVPVALVAGQVGGGLAGERPAPGGPPGGARAPAAVIALADLAGSTAAALASPRHWLRQAARQVARMPPRGMA